MLCKLCAVLFFKSDKIIQNTRRKVLVCISSADAILIRF